MKVERKPINEIKRDKRVKKEPDLYKNIPKITELELYNLIVYGTKKAPKI